MPRRINLELIPSVSSRLETFRKRKKSILKKMDQIRLLCGVKVCAAIKSPLGDKIEAWPSEREVNSVVERFNTSKPTGVGKHSMNQESQLRKTILEFRQKLARQENKNKKLVSDFVVNGFGMDCAKITDAGDMGVALGQLIKEIDKRIAQLKGESLCIDLNKTVRIR